MGEGKVGAIILALLVMPFGGGCATHEPISESLVFHDVATRPSHRSHYGVGIVGTVSPSRKTAVVVSRRKYPNLEEDDNLSVNPHRWSGGVYYARFDDKGYLALSATVGVLVAGIDVTQKVWHRNYVTASFSGPRQWQLILQHRTYNSPLLAGAVGFAIRNDVYAFAPPSDSLFHLEEERVVSLGIRAFAFVRSIPEENGGLKVAVFVGYLPSYHRPAFSVSLAGGRF